MGKKLKFNDVTKIIEVIDDNEEQSMNDTNVEFAKSIKMWMDIAAKESVEKDEAKSTKKRSTIIFMISILSFVISVGTFGFNYYQKEADVKQADITIRKFDLDKKPLFECIVDKENLYDEERNWEIYVNWLRKNEILVFNDWLYENYPDKEDIYIDNKEFWKAYNDSSKNLEELTTHDYNDLKDEYEKYLSSKNYESYSGWKIFRDYEHQNITLKNTGAYISNARLEVFTFISYKLFIDKTTTYAFGINTSNLIFNEYWTGKFSSDYINYDMGSNSFGLEYIKDIQRYEKESLNIRVLKEFLTNGLSEVIHIQENDKYPYYFISSPVYFRITYLDIEKNEYTDWYSYNVDGHTLQNIKTYNTDVELPDGRPDFNTIDDLRTLQTAEILGYQNAQHRKIIQLDDGEDYLESAKQKIIKDLKEISENK